MQVVTHQPQAWFLLKEEQLYLLDVNCNHDAFGYSVMIQLNPSEREAYRQGGTEFLSQLAQSVQNAGPRSDLQLRDVSSQYAEKSLRAIQQWRSENQP